MAVNQTQIDIERLLFETGAIRVAPQSKPFWYTSGTIGPYYANTHFLLGGEAAANELLNEIEALLAGDRLLLPATVADRVSYAYGHSACYKTVVDYSVECLRSNVNMDDVDVVSGGARRDWFFSYLVARAFNKPHLTIFKDLSMALNEPVKYDGGSYGGGYGGSAPQADSRVGYAAATPVGAGGLAGMRCLHVSDIVTEASSYERAWSPALLKAGARIYTSLTILDRLQGGGAVLASLGIRHLSLAELDAGFFERAYAQGYIDAEQRGQLLGYIADPNGSMRRFLHENPDFIKNALTSGGKEAERARMCIDSKVYGEISA